MPPTVLPRPAPRRRTSLSTILIAAALIIVVCIAIVWAVAQRGKWGSSADPDPGPQPDVSTTSNPSGDPDGSGNGAAGDADGTSEDAGVANTEEAPSDADCRVVSANYQVVGDQLVITGIVQNGGDGVAKEAEVHVTVSDEYGDIVARRDVPTELQRIRAGHTSTFRAEMPVPALTGPPTIEAQVEWK